MCLIPKGPAKTTDKDIVVYKVLLKCSDGKYYSPYQEMQYEVNKLYTVNIGYHERNIFKVDDSPIVHIVDTVIEEGLHSFTSMGFAFLRAFTINGTVFEAIIPKGATYILGTDNDIVSTQLKLIEECH